MRFPLVLHIVLFLGVVAAEDDPTSVIVRVRACAGDMCVSERVRVTEVCTLWKVSTAVTTRHCTGRLSQEHSAKTYRGQRCLPALVHFTPSTPCIKSTADTLLQEEPCSIWTALRSGAPDPAPRPPHLFLAPCRKYSELSGSSSEATTPCFPQRDQPAFDPADTPATRQGVIAAEAQLRAGDVLGVEVGDRLTSGTRTGLPQPSTTRGCRALASISVPVVPLGGDMVYGCRTTF